MLILPILASLFAALNSNESSAVAASVPSSNVEVESFDIQDPSTVRLLSDVLASRALGSQLEATSKKGHGAKKLKSSSTSFLSDIVMPAKFRSLLDRNVSPASIFSDNWSMKELTRVSPDSAVISQDNPIDDSGRHLQNSAECTPPLEDGTVLCVLLDAPSTSYFTVFFDCPASVTTLTQCGDCEVLAHDNTPDELTDNPVCLSCQVCSSTSELIIEFDCTNIATGECASVDCAGNCFGETTPTGTPPTGTPPTSAPPPTITLPRDCIQTEEGIIGCFLENDPFSNFITVFHDCPSTLTSPRDCNACVILGPDGTDALTDNPECTSCSVCPTGNFPHQYDCRNLISGDCAASQCDGCSGGDTPTFSPPTSSGGIPTAGPPGSNGLPPALTPMKPPVVNTETNGSGGNPSFAHFVSLVITATVAGIALFL